MNGPGNGHYVTPAMVEKQAVSLRAKAKEASMKPLREWIEAAIKRRFPPIGRSLNDHEKGSREGYRSGLSTVLREVKAREDAEQENNQEIGDLLKTVQERHEMVDDELGNLCMGWEVMEPDDHAKPARAHLEQALDAARKLRDQAAHWRNLLREVLVGDTTMEERIEMARDLGVEWKGDTERVNENLNALDGHVAQVLEEKEGGAE